MRDDTIKKKLLAMTTQHFILSFKKKKQFFSLKHFKTEYIQKVSIRATKLHISSSLGLPGGGTLGGTGYGPGGYGPGVGPVPGTGYGPGGGYGAGPGAGYGTGSGAILIVSKINLA